MTEREGMDGRETKSLYVQLISSKINIVLNHISVIFNIMIELVGCFSDSVLVYHKNAHDWR